MTNKQLIAFHKRFANGEQHIVIDRFGKIVEEDRRYFWQQNAIYNQIGPMVEVFSKQYRNTFNTDKEFENAVYGKNGLVARLIPLQRAYNAIKNRKYEFLNRFATGILVVEDGSVDVDELQEEGLAPGKVIVYRQGSVPPTLLYASLQEIEGFEKELVTIHKEMIDIFEGFKWLYD